MSDEPVQDKLIYEREFWRQNLHLVAGLDEVGERAAGRTCGGGCRHFASGA